MVVNVIDKFLFYNLIIIVRASFIIIFVSNFFNPLNLLFHGNTFIFN